LEPTRNDKVSAAAQREMFGARDANRDMETRNQDRTPILGTQTRTIVAGIALSGMVLLATYGFLFVIAQSIWPGNPAENWLLSVLHQQYAAALGVPMSAAAALCIVLLLETVAGPIEIETPWLKFRGAAAPVIVWMLCFLAMIFGLSWLWVTEPPDARGKTDLNLKAGSHAAATIGNRVRLNTARDLTPDRVALVPHGT
jgi:hypothetical protein